MEASAWVRTVSGPSTRNAGALASAPLPNSRYRSKSTAPGGRWDAGTAAISSKALARLRWSEPRRATRSRRARRGSSTGESAARTTSSMLAW